MRTWGDDRSQRGRTIEQVYDSFASADTAFKEAEKRRLIRRYRLVTQDL